MIHCNITHSNVSFHIKIVRSKPTTDATADATADATVDASADATVDATADATEL